MRNKSAWIWRALLLAVWMLGWMAAHAGGPRFVTGSKGWVQSGDMMSFYTSNLAYSTDPGDLSVTVTHAQADAMVAAAAAAWNVPVSTVTLQQGGELAEHVSAANVYFDGSEMVFPADVSASNYRTVPIAVIYDTDGSVIDTLMGDGASDPSGCRQTGVVESVDAMGAEGKIHHAMLILNGRCVGSTSEQMLQMQYQLERAFGRVLGLAWSQLNDNLFTGATPPTAGQIGYWPIMHPIDVLCGTYSYQCMTNPFQLRPDDLSALALLYPVTSSTITSGKTLSETNAVNLMGSTYFPTTQGMGWLNIAVTRQLQGRAQPELWQVASGVTGVQFQQNAGNPVSGTETADQDVGMPSLSSEAQVQIARVPDSSVENLYMFSEPIDPLYTDEDAIAPYQRPPVGPSGSTQFMADWSARAGTGGKYQSTASNAASSCAPGQDGTQGAPAASDASGWWNGLLCSVGHSSWWSVSVKAGRSWTLEVTALDETGAPSMVKAQPVIGVWNKGDGGLPTVASEPWSMNSMAPGVTQLVMPMGAAAGSYTFAVADQYGEGRPDFAYQARVLYADSVAPAQVSLYGGQIVIHGEGFRQGNQVWVNGVEATVVSWSANQIVAKSPSMATAGSTQDSPVDVAVVDAATGGLTDISAAFTYSDVQPSEALLVSSPPALETGVTAATPFAVRLLEPDGVTPIISDTVQVTVVQGAAGLGSCSGTRTCVLTTDATGLVQTTVTGMGAGPVVLNATEVNGSAGLQVTVLDSDPVRVGVIANAPSWVAAGASASWTISLTATQDGAAAVGVPVTWTAGSGISLSGVAASTDTTGSSAVTVSASQIIAGAVTVTGCAWGTACANWTLTAVDAPQWRLSVTSGMSQSAHAGDVLGAVVLGVTDTAGHTLQGATVSLYQTDEGWEGVCAVPGRCAAAPVLLSARSTAVSDAGGSVAVTPLEVPGEPQVVNVAAVTGTQGFVSLSLPVEP